MIQGYERRKALPLVNINGKSAQQEIWFENVHYKLVFKQGQAGLEYGVFVVQDSVGVEMLRTSDYRKAVELYEDLTTKKITGSTIY